MEISEQELRTMIRDAVARHATRGPVSESPVVAPPAAAGTSRPHGSHDMFNVQPVGDECIIEPSVRCNHCGYCKSLGH